MFEVVDGDIFESGADIIVNPVNCEGISGKGLAKVFAKRYPDNQNYYEAACREGDFHPGNLLIFDRPRSWPHRIINAATKAEWRNPSSLLWIDSLATNIAKHLMGFPVDSIAIPALGAGLGGLPWIVVKSILERRLQHVDARILVYRPHELSDVDKAYSFGKTSDQYPVRCLHGKPLVDNEFTLPRLINFSRQDDAKKVYERRLGCYHPSALSFRDCDRALAYERLGAVPQQKRGKAFFDIGHAVHDAIQARLLAVRGKHGQTFKKEVEAFFKPLNIYGHCDGIFGDWIVEIKTMGKASFNNLSKPKKEHLLQIHCYMLALDIPRTIILYVCRDDGKMQEFRVHFQEKIMRTIASTIGEIESFLDREELPPQQPDFWRCKECKYEYICTPKTKKPSK